MAFNIEEFRKKRKFKYKLGFALFLGGLICLILDCTTSFPTPIRGAYVYTWWVPIMTVGGIFYYLSKRLPLEEAIGIAKKHGNELTVIDLVGEMSVTLNTAEATLRKLQRKGYAKPQKRGQEIVWVFIESKSASIAGKDKEVNPETGMTESQLEEFLESCELALGEMKELLAQLPLDDNFKIIVQRFWEVARKHTDMFREDSTKVRYLKDFPQHIRKMKSLLEEHIRLFKYRERKSVSESLFTIEETFDKATTSFDTVLERLLLNDVEAVRGKTIEIDMLLRFEELDSFDSLRETDS